MKTIRKRINSGRAAAALALALAMVLLAAVPVFATDYVPVKGDAQQSFKQYLVLDKNAQVPAIEFNYSITPGEAIPASEGRMEVLAGVGQPTVGSAVFTAEEEASAQIPEGYEVYDEEKCAVKTVNFDFSGVSFTEPGIYRYVVTMTSAGQQAVTYDIFRGNQSTEKKRILDVYVIDEDGVLKVDSYAFHELASQVPAGAEAGSASVASEHAKLADKSDGFTNYYATQELAFGKEVTGNQGARDKYFIFTLKITDAAPNTVYHVDLSFADSVSGSTDATAPANRGKTNPAQFTTDASGAATVNYYLCDDQYVLVKGLPQGCGYELSEDREDYISTAGIGSDEGEIIRGVRNSFTAPVSGTITGFDIYTGYTNTRNGIVPTGIILTAAPAAGALALGGGGIAAIVISKRRKDSEDEAV